MFWERLGVFGDVLGASGSVWEIGSVLERLEVFWRRLNAF